MTRWAQNWIALNAAIFAAFFVLASAAWAEDVTITSRQGALAMTGRVISFDGTYLTFESPYGPLTVDYAQVSCDGSACPDPATFQPVIRLSGAPRMADVLLPALVTGFAREMGQQVTTETGPGGIVMLTLSDGARFDIAGTSSAEGFADLISFEADIAMSLREVRAAERALATEVGLGDLAAPGQSRIIGLDALVPVVSPRQPVRDVSLADLSRAFAGEVTNWADLGGSDGPIRLHLGPEGDGEVQFFLDRVVRRAGRLPTSDITYHNSLAEMDSAVATDPGGLGIAQAGPPLVSRVLPLRDGCGLLTTPSRFRVKTQDYPLTTPLFLYLPEWRLHPLAQDFLTYLRGPAAQLIVRRSGFVGQSPEVVPLDAQGQRFATAITRAGSDVPLAELQRMVGLLMGLNRQSVSFRFDAGSVDLDAGSRSQLLLLAQAVRDGVFSGQTLWLVGFSDGQGAADANKVLSEERAQAVATELTKALRALPEDVLVRVAGFGEALPMACDDALWGREVNRRVELWVGSQ